MSGVRLRLVRCPKCDKVLPEPFGFPVYQCGGCATLLTAKKKSLGPGEEKLSSSPAIVEEGHFDMAGISPARSVVGESNGSKSPFRGSNGSKSPFRGSNGSKSPFRESDGSKSPFRESGLAEFYEGLPKSPMRERFLDDLVKRPVESGDVGRSPMTERSGSDEFDHDGTESPLRVQGGTPRSVRAVDVSRSPFREGMGLGGVGRSPARLMNGDAAESVVRRGPGSEVGDHRQSRDRFVGEQRRTWRDRGEDWRDQVSEGVESVFSDERGMTSEGSHGSSVRGGDRRSRGGMYKDERFRSDYASGYARRNEFDGPSSDHSDSSYGYDGRRQSFGNTRRPASVRELQLQRAELLRKYNELKDQLSDLDDAEASSPGFYNEADGYLVDEHSRHARGPMQRFPPDRNVTRQPHFSEPQSVDQFPGQTRRRPHSNQHLSMHAATRYVAERSLDFEQDRFESRVNDIHRHHPACDCSVCYSNNWQGGDRRSPQGQSSYAGLHQRSKSLDMARLCRPISGGSPFVLCNNCFRLLKLPGNFVAKHKNQQQLQCGACSTVISFHLQHLPSDSLSSHKKPSTVNVVDRNEVTNDLGPNHRHGSFATTSTDIGSYDFDASSLSKGHRINSNSTENTLGSTSSPRFSVDEHLSDATSARSSKVNSSEIPEKIRPPPGSPLQNHLDYSSQFNTREDAEKQIIENVSYEKGPLVVTDAIETDVPRNELPPSLSQDPEDIPVPFNDKGTQSPRDTLLNPLKDIESTSGRGSSRKTEVYVNGQAVSQRAVKRAEKLAGKIQPGEYWYDPKAGFWGVMGNRCLGIIPPNIQEFSIPLAENCSRGDSAVYVNGRELQTWDLDLLAGRGLPTTRDKHYVVDISGKVTDEQTRDFIVNLGRLAPSVERNKRGFGMQVPEQLYD